MPPPTARVELDYTGSERLTMNMGPQHPSAHGVFRAVLTLEGETVVGVDAVIGYLHRCHEKLAETLTYAQYPSIASKTDYVAAMTSEFAYVRAAETIGKIEVPKRAQYLRVIAAELQRVASHLLWLGTWCMDMGGALGGGATIFLYTIRERELILDLFESLVGARLLYGFYQVGGVRYDIPAGWGDAVPRDGRPHRPAHRRIRADARGQSVLHGARAGRRRHLARAGRGASASRVRCCAAPASTCDLRRADPYSSYEDFEFQVPVETSRRLLRPVSRADGGVPRVAEDRPPGARRPARRARSRRGPG